MLVLQTVSTEVQAPSEKCSDVRTAFQEKCSDVRTAFQVEPSLLTTAGPAGVGVGGLGVGLPLSTHPWGWQQEGNRAALLSAWPPCGLALGVL